MLHSILDERILFYYFIEKTIKHLFITHPVNLFLFYIKWNTIEQNQRYQVPKNLQHMIKQMQYQQCWLTCPIRGA